MLRKSSHILIEKNFSAQAKGLRQAFDANLASPTAPERFVWDYWHVPDQYTLLRTPAYSYFDEKLYMRFHHELVLWGRRTLGCWDISPPWMSCYIQGCKQELHSDVPHGPWAFVFSLTPRGPPAFSGGETLILRPEVLNYWRNFSTAQDRELNSFVDRIPSHFNQLTVFDPRYPHGVTEVRGTHDPRQGRLVIHGWFTEPKTYTEGFLPPARTEKVLNRAFDQVAELIQTATPVQGTLSLQMSVGKSGRVQKIRFATKNLLDDSGDSPKDILNAILAIYRRLEFSTARGPTQITVPLIIG